MQNNKIIWMTHLPDDILDEVFTLMGPAAAGAASVVSRDWCRIFRQRAVALCPRGPWAATSLVAACENSPSLKWINVGMTVSRFDCDIGHTPATSQRALTSILEGLGGLYLPRLITLNVNLSRADRSSAEALGNVLDPRCTPRLRDVMFVFNGALTDTKLYKTLPLLPRGRGLQSFRLKAAYMAFNFSYDCTCLSTIIGNALCAGIPRVRIDWLYRFMLVIGGEDVNDKEATCRHLEITTLPGLLVRSLIPVICSIPSLQTLDITFAGDYHVGLCNPWQRFQPWNHVSSHRNDYPEQLLDAQRIQTFRLTVLRIVVRDIGLEMYTLQNLVKGALCLPRLVTFHCDARDNPVHGEWLDDGTPPNRAVFRYLLLRLSAHRDLKEDSLNQWTTRLTHDSGNATSVYEVSIEDGDGPDVRRRRLLENMRRTVDAR